MPVSPLPPAVGLVPYVPPIHQYKSMFTTWYDRASVRRGVQHRFHVEPGKVYFPPELFRVVQHPLVQERGPDVVGELLVQRLYEYLAFTVELEETAVVPVASLLGRGRAPLQLSSSFRIDALKIATDEAYHSLFTYELMAQVAAATGVAPLLPVEQPFLRELADCRNLIDADLAALAPLLFAVVSETLISRILSDMPRDPRLPAVVRAVIQDHAADEGRHHAYFRDLLRLIWPQFPPDVQRRLGLLVPRLVNTFLAPNLSHTQLLLRAAGLNPAAVSEVMGAVHGQARPGWAEAANQTVRYFREVGALDQAEVYDRFAADGLLGGPA